ncbi:hypothetical protein EMCRGX_G018138 [Ephydatia muelleri]
MGDSPCTQSASDDDDDDDYRVSNSRQNMTLENGQYNGLGTSKHRLNVESESHQNRALVERIAPVWIERILSVYSLVQVLWNILQGLDGGGL